MYFVQFACKMSPQSKPNSTTLSLSLGKMASLAKNLRSDLWFN